MSIRAIETKKFIRISVKRCWAIFGDNSFELDHIWERLRHNDEIDYRGIPTATTSRATTIERREYLMPLNPSLVQLHLNIPVSVKIKPLGG